MKQTEISWALGALLCLSFAAPAAWAGAEEEVLQPRPLNIWLWQTLEQVSDAAQALLTEIGTEFTKYQDEEFCDQTVPIGQELGGHTIPIGQDLGGHTVPIGQELGGHTVPIGQELGGHSEPIGLSNSAR